MARTTQIELVSVIIPARNEEQRIGTLVGAILGDRPDGVDIEVIVMDDGSSDRTTERASDAGARVITIDRGRDGGNPAAARNRGARLSRGDPIVFLDADCLPREGWLETLLASHRDAQVVGGSLALPPGLPLTARCDYYCGWYHMHPERPRGLVRNHPPCNLSVRRDLFESTEGFTERHPVAYAHEELAWQADVRARGEAILFCPAAVVDHYNRSGLGNLLRRNYRWGYSSIQSKAETRNAYFAGAYRFPRLVIASSPLLAFITTPYVVYRWLRAGVLETIVMLPLIFAARLAHSLGMMVGGVRWLRTDAAGLAMRPKWE